LSVAAGASGRMADAIGDGTLSETRAFIGREGERWPLDVSPRRLRRGIDHGKRRDTAPGERQDICSLVRRLRKARQA
jgi:hypothetical protein